MLHTSLGIRKNPSYVLARMGLGSRIRIGIGLRREGGREGVLHTSLGTQQATTLGIRYEKHTSDTKRYDHNTGDTKRHR